METGVYLVSGQLIYAQRGAHRTAGLSYGNVLYYGLLNFGVPIASDFVIYEVYSLPSSHT